MIGNFPLRAKEPQHECFKLFKTVLRMYPVIRQEKICLKMRTLNPAVTPAGFLWPYKN